METIQFPADIKAIAHLCSKADVNYQDVGKKGWPQVQRLQSFNTELSREVAALMRDNPGKWELEHMPISIQIGAKQLQAAGLSVELELLVQGVRALIRLGR